MQYAVAFLEGIITFISPCLLPMLPIYISYFAGGGERSTKKTLLGALGFVSGFTVIFVAMGTLAGTIGSFLREYKGAVNLISGLIVILFGLTFLGIFKMNLFRGGSKTLNSREMGFFPAMLFGIIFSLGWTPCVGAFLGSALMLASQQGHVIKGMLMLLCYSLGLGIPFLLSAILIDYLKSALGQFTRNYTQTVKRAADNKRRYAPGWVHSTCLLRGFPKGAAPHLAHDFAEQSVVCYTLCRRCPENTVAAGEGKGI